MACNRDAAESYDPLSSDGIHYALQTGWDAAITIDNYLLGYKSSIEDYVNNQKKIHGNI